MARRFIKGNRQGGVTLIEILVAMVVMTIGLFMVYQIFPMGFATSYRSKNKTIATQLAQQKMEQILRSEEEVECRYNSTDGASYCRYRPPKIDSDEAFYGTDFDCRYYYGIPGTNRCATFDHYDKGVYDSADSWTAFDPPYDDFWWYVEVIPVLDPAANYDNYEEGTDRISLFRDYGALSRITVRVRGPIDSMSDELDRIDEMGDRRTGLTKRIPTEVVISTFVANKYIPTTEIDIDSTNSLAQGEPWDTIDDPDVIIVDNIRNFPFYNVLSKEEKTDKSLVFQVNETTGDFDYPDGETDEPTDTDHDEDHANLYRLDNIIIEKWYAGDDGSFDGPDDDSDGDEYKLYQTNKITRMEPVNPYEDLDSTGSTEISGYMYLAQPLYYNGSYDDWTMVSRETYADILMLCHPDDVDKYKFRVFLFVNIPKVVDDEDDDRKDVYENEEDYLRIEI